MALKADDLLSKFRHTDQSALLTELNSALRLGQSNQPPSTLSASDADRLASWLDSQCEDTVQRVLNSSKLLSQAGVMQAAHRELLQDDGLWNRMRASLRAPSSPTSGSAAEFGHGSDASRGLLAQDGPLAEELTSYFAAQLLGDEEATFSISNAMPQPATASTASSRVPDVSEVSCRLANSRNASSTWSDLQPAPTPPLSPRLLPIDHDDLQARAAATSKAVIAPSSMAPCMPASPLPTPKADCVPLRSDPSMNPLLLLASTAATVEYS